MVGLCISFFGRFQVRCGEQVSINIDNRRLKELLSYLLLYRDRPHLREMLATLLWPDGSSSQTKKYLRQALWQLQTILDDRPELENIQLLLVEPNWIQINPQAEFWFDVDILKQAFALAQGIPGQALDDQCVGTLQEAVKLYQADLLEGWYQDWCLYERERLQNMYLAMLDKLVVYCETHQRYEDGVVYGLHILRYDLARERTHRQLMQLYYLSGDRTAALRQYERCEETLQDQLGVKPARQTIDLYERIRTDHLGDLPTSVTQSASLSESNTVPLTEVLGRLKRLQTAMGNIQHQIQQEIQAFEEALKK
jgi:DNA-binding SARP family transcriptional activator